MADNKTHEQAADSKYTNMAADALEKAMAKKAPQHTGLGAILGNLPSDGAALLGRHSQQARAQVIAVLMPYEKKFMEVAKQLECASQNPRLQAYRIINDVADLVLSPESARHTKEQQAVLRKNLGQYSTILIDRQGRPLLEVAEQARIDAWGIERIGPLLDLLPKDSKSFNFTPPETPKGPRPQFVAIC